MPVIDVPQPAFMEEEEIAIFADAVGKFYAQHAPLKRVEKWREDGMVEREFWREAGAAGLLGVSVPTEYGGHGGDFRHDMVVIDQQGKHGVDGFGASLHNTIILPYLVRHGTEEQKQKYLPLLASGEMVGAIAMSEPAAGSDLQGIKTTAIAQPDGSYLLNGSKTFITNGWHADLVIVVAKTDPAAGAKGTTLLLVERGMPGFEKGKRLKKLGLKAQDTSELFFDNVRVPADHLLGEENAGFRYLMHELAQERLVVAVRAAASIEAFLHKTIAYTRERKAFGQPVFDFQNTRFKLAEAKAQATMLRVFVDDCIALHLRRALAPDRAAMVKLNATALQNRLLDEFLQLHGGYGYMTEYQIGRAWTDARIGRIYGGSDEIMKEIIGRTL